MKLCRIFRQKRGISPLIATIILIAICVAGGALIYSIFFSTTSTLNATGQLNIQSMNLIKDTNGNANFALTIKNVGNKPFTSISIKLAQENPVTIDSIKTTTPLQPGQTTSYTTNLTEAYDIGNNYNIIIEAQTTDGSKIAQAASVMCTTG